jgi:hypothetical protein
MHSNIIHLLPIAATLAKRSFSPNGFSVEQTGYMNVFSDDGLRDVMNVMFESWP